MNIKKILSDNMYGAFLALCAVLLSESALLRLGGISSPVSVGLTSVIFMAVTVFLHLNRKNSAAYIGTAAVMTLIIWALNTAGINVFALGVTAADSFLSGKALDDGEVFLVSAIMSTLLSAVFFALLKIRVVRFAAAAAVLAALIAYGFCGISADPVETFAAAGIVIAVLSEICVALTYKKEKRLNSVVSFLLPVFAVFSLAAAIIPSSTEPIKWEFACKIATGIVNFFENIATEIGFALNPASSEFAIGMQGYSDGEGIFGAGISSDGALQLTFSAYIRPRAAVYLIGNANDTYTGTGWSKSKYADFSENDYYLDYCEAVCAFERAGYTSDDLADFTAFSNVTVTYRDIITKTLFYPLKTISVFSPERFNAASPSIVFDSKQADGASYILKYFEIDYRSDQFMTVAGKEFDYGSADGTEHYLDKKISADITDKLSERSDYIHDVYTALPELITERTRELAERITAGCATDYDKLRAIEAYLRGYTYTTAPGAVPDGADPVDYFLFESREGYCTYFASAMTILARCVGVPTRYVQGFSVNIGADVSITEVLVTNTNAHAWSEGYIKGVGWVPFEPTAAYADSRYSFRGRPKASSYSYSNPYDYYHHEEDDYSVEPLPEIETESELPVFVPIILFTLPGLLIIALLYITVRLRRFTGGYKQSSDTEKFMICYKMIIYLCGRNKLVREDGETARSFAERISLKHNEIAVPFDSIAAVFDKIRYGGYEATCGEREEAEHYLRLMFDVLGQTRGKLTALYAFIGYCFG